MYCTPSREKLSLGHRTAPHFALHAVRVLVRLFGSSLSYLFVGHNSSVSVGEIYKSLKGI